MQTLNKIALIIIIGISMITSPVIDFFYDMRYKLFKDDSTVAILTVVAIMATGLTIFGICYHFDIAGIIQDYYYELCRQITWT